jgi:hypothetical protein
MISPLFMLKAGLCLLEPSWQKIRGLFKLIGRLIKISEKIFQGLLNPDIDIYGDVDWFHLNRCHGNITLGFDNMLGAAYGHEKTDYRKPVQTAFFHLLPPAARLY